MPVVTPPVVDPNTIPGIIKTPTTGQTYNPVTPQRLAQIAANWQTMSPEARVAAERNQAAAIAAANRVRERNEQKQAMEQARLQLKRDRYHEQLALQKRQEKEETKIKRDANIAATKAQQQRVLQQQGLRGRREDALRAQRVRETENRNKQKTLNAQRNATLAQQRRTQQANDAAAARQKATAFRTGIQGGKEFGAAQARQYFQGQGANYDQYAGSVNAALRNLAAQLNPSDTVDRAEFGEVGEQVYNQLLNQGRNAAAAKIRPQFSTGYEQRLLPDAAINPAIQGIEQEQFGEAQEYIDNLLKRGVIQQEGYNKALQNLQGQRGAVNVQLQDIGNDILAGGRQKLTDIGNTAGLAAGNLALGQGFNSGQYGTQTAQAIANFNKSLPGALKTQIQGSLFDTTKLAGIAGKAQGAQNLNFDPYTVAGTAQPKNPLFDPAMGMKSVF